MKTLLLPSTAALLLLVAAPAIGQGGKPALEAPQPPVTAAELIGRWGDNGDCTKDVVFHADGAFTSYTGGGGRWSLTGDRLVLTGPGGEYVMRVRWDADGERLIIANPDGSIGTSQRC